jgi:hypothetical protein
MSFQRWGNIADITEKIAGEYFSIWFEEKLGIVRVG